MNKNTVEWDVAMLIASADPKGGIPTHIVHQAGRGYGVSGDKRNRDLAKEFRIIKPGVVPYYYDHNTMYPHRAYQQWLRQQARKAS